MIASDFNPALGEASLAQTVIMTRTAIPAGTISWVVPPLSTASPFFLDPAEPNRVSFPAS